jgi:hypothetical protein
MDVHYTGFFVIDYGKSAAEPMTWRPNEACQGQNIVPIDDARSLNAVVTKMGYSRPKRTKTSSERSPMLAEYSLET